LYGDDLGASILFTLVFLASLVGLVFLLAWLEQPAAERWWPRWWAERHQTRRPVPPPARPVRRRSGDVLPSAVVAPSRADTDSVR
jgi:hypothetical protein